MIFEILRDISIRAVMEINNWHCYLSALCGVCMYTYVTWLLGVVWKGTVKFSSLIMQVCLHCWLRKSAHLFELLSLPNSWKLRIWNGSVSNCSVSESTLCNAFLQQGCTAGLVSNDSADKLLHLCLCCSNNLWSNLLMRSEGTLTQCLWCPRPYRLGHHVVYVSWIVLCMNSKDNTDNLFTATILVLLGRFCTSTPCTLFYFIWGGFFFWFWCAFVCLFVFLEMCITEIKLISGAPLIADKLLLGGCHNTSR